MIVLLAAWAFGSFIYFKVALDYVFRSDVSIVAALLGGAATAITIFIVTGAYAYRLLKFNWTPGAVPLAFSTVIWRTIVPLILAIVGLTLAVRLIIYGFSKELSQEIVLFRYNGDLREDSFQLLPYQRCPCFFIM